MNAPGSDVPPAGYPPSRDQNQTLGQSPYGPYGQQPPYQQAPYAQPPYGQPPFQPAPYAYPPGVAGYAADPYGPKPAPYTQHPQPHASPPPHHDVESQLAAAHAHAFADKATRLGFVRKVFALLTVMLGVTTGVVLLFMFEPRVQKYLKQNIWPFWTAFAFTFGTLIYLSCSPKAARKYPLNYVFLFIFTLGMSVLVGAATMWAAPEAVLIAACCTLGVVLAITLFAMQTKFDFTMMGGGLIALLFVLIIASLIGWFVRAIWWHIMVSAFGALLFSLFLIHDVQLIMGKGKHALSPDDYVFGALALYIDIINIFMYILTIVGLARQS